MKCFKIQNKLNAFVDKELPKKQIDEIKKHLLTCTNCQKKLREIQNLNKILEDNKENIRVPEEIYDSIMKKIPREHPKNKFFIRNLPIAASFIFSLLLGAIIAFSTVQTQFQEQDSDSLQFASESFAYYLQGVE